MNKTIYDLPKLEPVKFRDSKTGKYVTPRIVGSKGKPTKSVIAEIKKLSRKDIYAAD